MNSHPIESWLAPLVAALAFSGLIVLSAIAGYTVWEFANRDIKQTQATRSEFGTEPPDCWHLYDRGLNDEWSECMGVEYK